MLNSSSYAAEMTARYLFMTLLADEPPNADAGTKLDWVAFAPAIALVAASVIGVILQWLNIRSIKQELENAHIVVKDGGDLRKILERPLEGIWVLRGEFSVFQGRSTPHFSAGYLILTWEAHRSRYSAVYVYSVREQHAPFSVATAICTGFTSGELVDGKALDITLSVESRTVIAALTNLASTFVFKARYESSVGANRKLVVSYATATTSGVLVFER